MIATPRSPARLLILAPAMLALVALSGCGTRPVTTFDLTSRTSAQTPAQRAGEALTIVEPVALQSLDGTTLVVRGQAGELTMISNAQWADRLPRLVQTRIVRALEDSGRLGRIARPGDGIVTARQLNTELRQFNVDSASGMAVVEISARVVDSLTGRVVRARIFTARVPVSGGVNGATAAVALDAALAEVLTDLVNWA
ncbi:ABC-type transport auxiliary lipoprotein family protein [Pseudochelatococcus contaminans]|uniref:Cholesterol transport system auxiliary component n=1 Tax=Pseudochelatococcus contaminans TaxID=1538103 RepID=A0A7W5Z4X6_9HYPH|nr:ABC-type transport auxiliary lipoprotein family protein [Pseudochelatococcus contaminans]MBB3810044.1 cholesterol transport system auxiliary component [Pseudochelatococcus contaminans]